MIDRRVGRRLVLGSVLAVAVAAVLLVLIAGSLAVAATGSGRLGARAAAASVRLASQPSTAASPDGFSHAVVVDEQRPGFEPDVKYAPDGTIFTSVPFGFSTTESFVWSSRDHGNSYQLTPGNIGTVAKPQTCVGGGDTDLYVDPGNALYFSDLQGLTNISNSVSTDGGASWSTNCAGAPNTPDDRMWFAGQGSLSKGNLRLFQDYDVVGGTSGGGNALVETVSTNGTAFTPVVNTSPGTDCAGIAVQDCVTGNEGISGNQVDDPNTGNIYIAHTTTEGSSGEVGVRVAEGKVNFGTPTTATWTESPNLDGPLCPNSTLTSDGSHSCVDSSGNPEEIAGENFASIARDSAGYLYVTFTAGPLDHASSSDPNFGASSAPEQIYVVHSLEPAGSNPAKLTWSAPQKISGSGLSAGTNTFPWIVAGSDGRVDVAWYHTPELSERGTCASGSGTCTNYGASALQHAEWNVVMAQSLDAHAATPTYRTSQVSEAPVKYGAICTNGIGCATGGDRSLGDFLQVAIDSRGAALVSYVFDTSADTSAGENAGPEVISRQISGPSLTSGDVSQGSGPGQAVGSVSDPTGDAFYSANGTRTPDPVGNLDLTGASLSNGPGSAITAKIDVRNLHTLAPASSVGGPDASWLIRWTVVDPGTTGNGHIYYAGMDDNQGAGGSGTPTFFVGDTAGFPPSNPEEHTKFLTYPQSHLLSGSEASYNPSSGVITLHVPRADVGNPANGKVLYSVTAFSATSATPQSSSTLFNLIDATTPFDFVVSSPAISITPPSYSGSGRTAPRCQLATGRLRDGTVGPLSLGMTRRRARQRITHYASHGRAHEDFFCLRPKGIRAGYGYRRLLRGLPAA
ncbi:MAG TPA: hypothetical protein VFP55_00025, partial [Solirubrobacteraceae bacterium]|nr:hypothetical protein [Solirubrobacteraceae bacterium]